MFISNPATPLLVWQCLGMSVSSGGKFLASLKSPPNKTDRDAHLMFSDCMAYTLNKPIARALSVREINFVIG